MKITKTTITVRELFNNYSDKGEDGVVGYDNKLQIRPSYQREFVYQPAQRDAVIHTIRKNLPLNIMYWSKTGDNTYEVLDGQQRTISICQYLNKDFSLNHQFFHNLTKEEQDQILDYELEIYICEGTEAEKLEWFKIINTPPALLTAQELLNATYTGPWLADAKRYFSKRKAPASQMSDGYLKGNPIRQELLEKVLFWISDKYGFKDKAEYMAQHQHDNDANEIWLYFQSVIYWAKTLFPQPIKGVTDSVDWGVLYNTYHDNSYNSNTLNEEVKRLIMDDDVTNKKGIIPYLLSGRTHHDERCLSIRAFTESQKLRAYERQGHKCPICQQHGDETEYEFKDMQGDHVIPWSKGGTTTDDNLQMLCKKCNAAKTDN